MKTLLSAVALSAVLTLSGAAATTKPSLLPLPSWLPAAERQKLRHVFGGASPIHTTYIRYPRKIAIVFEFNHDVICGRCSAPTNASLVRGRVIRFTYDLKTYADDGVMFCARNGLWPPREDCLRR